MNRNTRLTAHRWSDVLVSTRSLLMQTSEFLRRLVSVTALPLVTSSASAIACYWAAGPRLGLFLGGLLMVTVLAPPLAVAEGSWRDRLLSLAGLVLPVIVVWA